MMKSFSLLSSDCVIAAPDPHNLFCPQVVLISDYKDLFYVIIQSVLIDRKG